MSNAFRETYDEPHTGPRSAAEWAIREAWKLAYARKGQRDLGEVIPSDQAKMGHGTGLKGGFIASDWWARGSECESVTPEECRWLERIGRWYPPIPWVGKTKKQWNRIHGR